MLKWTMRALMVIVLAVILAGGMFWVVERSGFAAGFEANRPAMANADGSQVAPQPAGGRQANGRNMEGRQPPAGDFEPGRGGPGGMERHGGGGAGLLMSLAKIVMIAVLVVLGQQGFEWLLRRRRTSPTSMPAAAAPAPVETTVPAEVPGGMDEPPAEAEAREPGDGPNR